MGESLASLSMHDAGVDLDGAFRLLASSPFQDPVSAVLESRLTGRQAARQRARDRIGASAWPRPLLLAAGDHPARLLTAWRGDPLALADRGWYLRTLAGLLASRAVDGLEASPDVMEELLHLDALAIEDDLPSFLDGRILIGTVNRAGLAGTIFEMADVASGFTVQSARALRLDGLKWMFRLAPDDPMGQVGLQALINGLAEANAAGLPVMLEIDWVERGPDGTWRTLAAQPEKVAALAGVVSGIGPLTEDRWLELPLGPSLAVASRATTLPILGLPPESSPAGSSAALDYAMPGNVQIQGQLIGRDIMLAETPLIPAAAVAAIWRRGLQPQVALAHAEAWWSGVPSTIAGSNQAPTGEKER